MLKNWKGINPMGLSASLAEYKNKQYFTNIKKLQKAPRDGVEQGEGERGGEGDVQGTGDRITQLQPLRTGRGLDFW